MGKLYNLDRTRRQCSEERMKIHIAPRRPKPIPMKTVTIQIGNTDNKLTQEDWSEYVNAVNNAVGFLAHKVHFFGGPSAFERWQNAAWIIEVYERVLEQLKLDVAKIRAGFSQDSAAWTEGETRFI